MVTSPAITVIIATYNLSNVLPFNFSWKSFVPENIVFMGDDMPDVQAIQYAGLGCCPQDAIPEAKAVSQYISHKNGGDACVRDIIEQVMKVHGKWKVQDGESVKST